MPPIHQRSEGIGLGLGGPNPFARLPPRVSCGDPNALRSSERHAVTNHAEAVSALIVPGLSKLADSLSR